MSDSNPPPPPGGGFSTDPKEAKAQAKAAKAHAKAMRPWYKKKRFIGGIAIVVIIILIASSSSEDDTSKVASSNTTADAGDPATNSTDTTLSSVDEMDDVTITSCEEEFGIMNVGLTIVNNSSKTSNYIITLGFIDSSGTKVGDGVASANNVEPGQTAKTEGMGTVTDDAEGVTCKVDQVERYAS